MGFKADTSFLKFLTMGAAGVRRTLAVMEDMGFRPIELERYGSSNKIWSTKVKRLRLPDILCVATGVRVEVRAKSDLKIRMSDAPTNPDRRWDSGLRDDDLVAFIACETHEGEVAITETPNFFTAADLRASVDRTKLGPPKSASEGAERDREWPCTVPKKSGSVTAVTRDKITAVLDSGRLQTYQLGEKRAYVNPGQRFVGGASIIAGVVSRPAPIEQLLSRRWDCRSALLRDSPVDRYAAAKAVPHTPGAERWGQDALFQAMKTEADFRVSLEMAASAARLGAAQGMDYVSGAIWQRDLPDMRMEAVLILGELGTSAARDELIRVATGAQFAGDEIRQAAVWSLGKQGLRSYGSLLAFISDEERDVALHAIAAFGTDTPQDVILELVERLIGTDSRGRAAASMALKIVGSEDALTAVIRAAKQHRGDPAWLLATIGRFPAARVRQALTGDPLLAQVAPLLVLGPEDNWLGSPLIESDVNFLLLQDL